MFSGATLHGGLRRCAPNPPYGLWEHPRAIITPHNAAESDPRALVSNVLEQIARLERGEPLQNVIDRGLGY